MQLYRDVKAFEDRYWVGQTFVCFSAILWTNPNDPCGPPNTNSSRYGVNKWKVRALVGKGSQGMEELTIRRGVEILSFLEQKARKCF